MAPDAETCGRIRDLLGSEAVFFRSVTGGYTPAERWLVRLASGERAFVKIGTTSNTAAWLRDEHKAYRTLNAEFMPDLLAWQDHPTRPLLILEDLSEDYWPPPWEPELVRGVVEVLEELHAMDAPLPTFAELTAGWEARGWRDVENNPEPFLSLELASKAWLDSALPLLLEQERTVSGAGAAVIHTDVRSDNLCLTERGVKLIDWNLACRGDPDLDLAFWLPSLEAEGGPEPQTLLPDRADLACWVSGFFAARAGLPEIPEAPRVRTLQRQQLAPALAWAARELELQLPSR